VPLPKPQKLEWQDCELGMLIHFGRLTFKPRWNWRSCMNKPVPNDYNPVKLDTDQWLEAARSMGAGSGGNEGFWVAKPVSQYVPGICSALKFRLKSFRCLWGTGFAFGLRLADGHVFPA
jgi:hypothetical protein